MYHSCPVCGAQELFELINIKAMPVYCNVLHATREQAMSTSLGDIDLVFCKECSHIYNRTFDPAKMDYSVEYENSLHYSKVFNEFSEKLAQELVDRYNLQGKNIVEIGCGKGDFLESVCSKGGSHGFGFDKSFDHDRDDKEAHPHVTFYQEFYGPQHASVPLDFLCCRHVLEHIQHPVEFVSEVTSVSPNAVRAGIYFEVPNGLFTLRDFGIWDIIYEHCSYFTPLSLALTFEKGGCDVTSIEETFSSQFLSLQASRQEGEAKQYSSQFDDEYKQRLRGYAVDFLDQYKALTTKWNARLQEIQNQGKKAVIWGTGSKGVTFLNVFKEHQSIDAAVDLNPHKHGMYVPGSGQKVVAPEQLKEDQPDLVIVMNSIYKEEIQEHLHQMGVRSEVTTV